ncbi:MAG: response regulator [Anaerolineae bacterium]|nr:response regulator [Anaerolineae bacterium]
MGDSLPTSPRILVIDDDNELLKLVTMLLNRIGAQTLQAKNGVRGLEILMDATAPIDLIILDLMLPDIDGFELLRRIREQARFDTVPIIILSARADPDSVRYGLDHGADGYITKPYIANNLIDRIKELISARQ